MIIAIFDKIISHIDFYDPRFITTVIMIIICPITWNLFARIEFNTKYFSKLAGDNVLAADIFAHILIEMGIFRNYMFKVTVDHQKSVDFSTVYELEFKLAGYIFAGIGSFLVAMSFYRLGIHGIYYADYFGILMKEKVTAFPYNYIENPLYVGASLIFAGKAIEARSASGVVLTILAIFMYKIASILENPMTNLIYSQENIKAVNKMKEERIVKGKEVKRKHRESLKKNNKERVH
jgi:phosphatidylethanolamine N-methyltransferase